MCGRFSLAVSKERIKKKYNIKVEEEIEPNYNIAPTQEAYVITNQEGHKIQKLQWGLIPYWAKDSKVGTNLINARCESVSSKPSFRMPIRKRRCLVIADGFYEWRKEGRNRIPYRITMKDDALITMAGIWDTWMSPEREEISTFAILTTAPNQEMQFVHDRMPVILSTTEEQQKWLDKLELEETLNLMQTLENDRLDIFPVSKRVNSVSFNKPSLYKEIQLPPTLF